MCPGLVDHPPSQPIQRIDLADDDALPDAAEARVARADAQVLDFRGDQRGPRPGASGRRACLGSGVPAAHHDNIEWPAVAQSARIASKWRTVGAARNKTNLECAATVAKLRRWGERRPSCCRPSTWAGRARLLGRQTFFIVVRDCLRYFEAVWKHLKVPSEAARQCLWIAGFDVRGPFTLLGLCSISNKFLDKLLSPHSYHTVLWYGSTIAFRL